MTSRLGTREQRDAEHRLTHPFEVRLKLMGVSGEWAWGRFTTAERARDAGDAAKRATHRSQVPYGRVCRSYRVVDTRTGEDVPAPALDRAA